MDECIAKPLDDRTLWPLLRLWLRRERPGSGPARCPVPATGDMPQVYDREAALLSAGGNSALADKLWNMLISDLPEQRRAFSAALEGAETGELRRQAHSLAGLAAYCCTPALKAAISDLQAALRNGRHDRVPELGDAVLIEIDRLIASAALRADEERHAVH